MELLNQAEMSIGQLHTINNITSGAISIVAEAESGDRVEVTLHPGASIKIKFSTVGVIRLYNSEHNFPGLLSVDSDEYRRIVRREDA